MRTDCRHNLASKVIWCLSKKGVETFVYNRREGRNRHISYLSEASPFICFPVCELPLYVQGRPLVCFECLPAYEKRLSLQRVIVAPENLLIFWYCCRYGPCYPLLYRFLSSMTPSLGGSDHHNGGSICPAVLLGATF